jgi:ABC-type polysaccharide/polyol phosphate export permease
MLTNGLQLLFLVTPVIWMPALLGDAHWIADCNPLHSLIAVVREPLLGHAPAAWHYAVVLALTLLGGLAAALFYGRFRQRVVYWL